jgi:ABC-type sugar transport system permease subunit
MVASDAGAALPRSPARTVTRVRPRRSPLPYLLMLPAATILVGLFATPFASLFVYALRRTELSGDSMYVGLANFVELLHEEHFHINMVVSAGYLAGVLVLTVPVSYAAALLVTRKARGVALIRTLLLTPWVLAPVVTAMLFRTMVDPAQGPVSAFTEWLFGQPVNLVSDGTGALILIIVHSTWRSIPFVMLLLAAAMSGIPRELYDAVKADGAGPWQAFRYVTLPLTRTALLTACLMLSVFALQDTESVYALTRGGPGYSTEPLAVRLFKEAFLYYNVGGGAAIGVVLVAVTVVVMVALLRLSRRLEADR